MMEVKPKIFFVIDAIQSGGTELQLLELIKQLSRINYEVTLVTLRGSNLDINNCRHIDLNLKKLISLSCVHKVYKLSKLMKKENVGVVQCYFMDAVLIGILSARLAGVKVRITCFRDMGFWLNKRYFNALNLVYKLSTHFVSNSFQVREYFENKFGLERNKSFVIGNGIDTEKFSLNSGISDEVRTVVIVANMTRLVKRVDVFVEAAIKLASKRTHINWVVVGDGYLKDDLIKRTKENQVEHNFQFLGNVSDVNLVLNNAQVGVNTSESEGQCNAIIEYMSKGIIPVVSDVEGNNTLVQVGKTGIFFEVNNVSDLVNKLELVLDDAELRLRISRNAREYCVENFGWQSVVANFQKLYVKKEN